MSAHFQSAHFASNHYTSNHFGRVIVLLLGGDDDYELALERIKRLKRKQRQQVRNFLVLMTLIIIANEENDS